MKSNTLADFSPLTPERRPLNGSALRSLVWEPARLALTASLSLNVLMAEALIFTWGTTFGQFVRMNRPFYVWSSIGASLALAGMAGLALSLAIHPASTRSRTGVGRGLLGTALVLLSVGCPACGDSLLPRLGMSGGLAAFPLQGLEIKLLAGLLLGSSIGSASRRTGSKRSLEGASLQESEASEVENTHRWRRWRAGPAILTVGMIAVLYALPSVPSRMKLDFSTDQTRLNKGNGASDTAAVSSDLVEQINPALGFVLPAAYGDLGPQLLAAGAIDLDRFVRTYQQAGAPLSKAQVDILTQGSDRPIVIDRENSYFLLNFFWALGLTNQNRLLDEGPMQISSQGDIGRFASTGGWTLGKRPATDLYSSAPIVTLTSDQQILLEEVAAGVYRPCCNNPTAFPDCNHGMAMLGLLEWLASQGATRDQMFEAAKYANAFWFPQQALEVAVFFKATRGMSFSDARGEEVVGAELFSAAGFRNLHTWLVERRLLEQTPSGGPSCGV